MPMKGKCSICGEETFLTMMPVYDGDELYLRLVCPVCYEWYLKLEKGMEKEQAGQDHGNTERGKAE